MIIKSNIGTGIMAEENSAQRTKMVFVGIAICFMSFMVLKSIADSERDRIKKDTEELITPNRRAVIENSVRAYGYKGRVVDYWITSKKEATDEDRRIKRYAGQRLEHIYKGHIKVIDEEGRKVHHLSFSYYDYPQKDDAGIRFKKTVPL